MECIFPMQDLTKSNVHPMGGQAYLSLENSEDPFLHGIKFTAMPPSKRFREMEQLSGGEKVTNGLVPMSRAIFGNAFLHILRSTPASTYLAHHELESIKGFMIYQLLLEGQMCDKGTMCTFAVMLSAVACHYFLSGVFSAGISRLHSIHITAQRYLWHCVNTRYIIHFSVGS